MIFNLHKYSSEVPQRIFCACNLREKSVLDSLLRRHLNGVTKKILRIENCFFLWKYWQSCYFKNAFYRKIKFICKYYFQISFKMFLNCLLMQFFDMTKNKISNSKLTLTPHFSVYHMWHIPIKTICFPVDHKYKFCGTISRTVLNPFFILQRATPYYLLDFQVTKDFWTWIINTP